MTKDKALRNFYAGFLGGLEADAQVGSYTWCSALVAGLERLGILKLDAESDNPLDALALSMSLAGSSGPLTAVKVAGHLDVLGFKVVKK